MGLTEKASNGIEAEVTVGKKEEKQQIEVGNTENKNEQKAEEIVNYVDNIPPMVLFFLVLGWLLPSPGEIWKGVLSLFKLRRVE